MTTDEELKGCPFCGYKANLCFDHNRCVFFIKCSQCFIGTEEYRMSDVLNCEFDKEYSISKKQIIEKWNTRDDRNKN